MLTMGVLFAPTRAAPPHRIQPQAYSTGPPSSPCYSCSILASMVAFLLSYGCRRPLLVTCLLLFFTRLLLFQHTDSSPTIPSQRDINNNNNNTNNTILPTDAASRRLLWDPGIDIIAVWEAFNGDASECTIAIAIAEVDCCHSHSSAVASPNLHCNLSVDRSSNTPRVCSSTPSEHSLFGPVSSVGIAKASVPVQVLNKTAKPPVKFKAKSVKPTSNWYIAVDVSKPPTPTVNSRGCYRVIVRIIESYDPSLSNIRFKQQSQCIEQYKCCRVRRFQRYNKGFQVVESLNLSAFPWFQVIERDHSILKPSFLCTVPIPTAIVAIPTLAVNSHSNPTSTSPLIPSVSKQPLSEAIPKSAQPIKPSSQTAFDTIFQCRQAVESLNPTADKLIFGERQASNLILKPGFQYTYKSITVAVTDSSAIVAVPTLAVKSLKYISVMVLCISQVQGKDYWQRIYGPRRVRVIDSITPTDTYKGIEYQVQAYKQS